MRITQLDKKKHDRKDFDCGEAELNNYIKSKAGQHSAKSIAHTFVAEAEDAPTKILGFYTLTLTRVELDELPEPLSSKYPRNIASTLIGRLAVSSKHQNQRLGSRLLIDAIRRAVISSESVPSPMILIEAKNERVREYYKNFGFIEMKVDPNKLLMTMASAKAMLVKSEILPP